jgi:hypothetical protein
LRPFAPQKTHNIMLLFCSTLLRPCRHFNYWNQPLNMSIHVCNLDCYDEGLCCYLVVQIGNLLRLLQLFYFNLWPNYWISLVNTRVYSYISVALVKRKPPRPRFRCSLYSCDTGNTMYWPTVATCSLNYKLRLSYFCPRVSICYTLRHIHGELYWFRITHVWTKQGPMVHG